MRLRRWWSRADQGCRECEHQVEAPGCVCPLDACVCRQARQARFDEMFAPLSPRDREWVLSHRRDLAVAAASGDLAQVRRIFEHQITEAEDPAAVSRVLR